MDSDFVKIVQGRSVSVDKGLDCHEAVQAFSVKGIDNKSRQVVGIASSETLDRDGEIVTIDALRKAMKGYMKNPVVLAGHTHRTDSGHSPTVGKVVEWRIANKQLLVTIQFAKTELGEEYWILYRDKVQRAFSIGFRILPDGHKQEIIEGRQVSVITAIDLYEISCVPVPANAEALTKSRKRKQDFVNRKRVGRSGWPFNEEEGSENDSMADEFAKAFMSDEYDMFGFDLVAEMLERIRALYPDFDEKCKEFAKTNMPGEYDALDLPERILEQILAETSSSDEICMEVTKVVCGELTVENHRDQGTITTGKDIDFAVLVYPGKYS